MDILERLSNELNISHDRLTATVALLDEGNTVPFVARYRKEVTGGGSRSHRTLRPHEPL